MLYRFGAKKPLTGESSIKTAISDEKRPKYFYGRFCAWWAIGLF
jgi:hypothetical protein